MTDVDTMFKKIITGDLSGLEFQELVNNSDQLAEIYWRKYIPSRFFNLYALQDMSEYLVGADKDCIYKINSYTYVVPIAFDTLEAAQVFTGNLLVTHL